MITPSAAAFPDVTFFDEDGPRVGRRRINVQQQDRLEREKDDFHVRTYEGYLELEKNIPAGSSE